MSKKRETLSPLVAPSSSSAALIRNALKVCPLMNHWPDSVIDQITAIARLGRYGKQTPMPESEQFLREAIVVVAGRLLIEGVDLTGSRFVLALHGPGEILGLVRLLPDIRFTYHFQLEEGTVLVHLPADPLMAVLDAHPPLWRDVAFQALSRLQNLIARQQLRATGHIYNQVSDLLVRLSATVGKRLEDKEQVNLALSQNDLAAMLGVSRQTVNKQLGLLHKERVIDAGYGYINILDMHALRQRAG